MGNTRRQGRPKLSAKHRRSRLGVYLTQDEKRSIMDAAKGSHVGISAWCRLTLLNAAEYARQREAERMIGKE